MTPPTRPDATAQARQLAEQIAAAVYERNPSADGLGIVETVLPILTAATAAQEGELKAFRKSHGVLRDHISALRMAISEAEADGTAQRQRAEAAEAKLTTQEAEHAAAYDKGVAEAYDLGKRDGLAAQEAYRDKGERVFEAVVYAFEGRPVPDDLHEHGMVRRALKYRAAQEEEVASVRADGIRIGRLGSEVLVAEWRHKLTTQEAEIARLKDCESLLRRAAQSWAADLDAEHIEVMDEACKRFGIEDSAHDESR